MKKDFLTQLLNDPARTKFLRLVLFNQEEGMTLEEIMKRAQLSRAAAQKQARALEGMKLIKKVSCTRMQVIKKGKSKKEVSKKIPGWQLDQHSEHAQALAIFVRAVSPISGDDIPGKLRGAGKIKLVVSAGLLCNDKDGRVDLLIVGDVLNERKVGAVMRSLEADLGHEVRYAAFSTDDFTYRLTVCDKLVRDIFDYPHEVLFDRIDIQRFLG